VFSGWFWRAPAGLVRQSAVGDEISPTRPPESVEWKVVPAFFENPAPVQSHFVLALLFFRFILASLRSTAPLDFRQPLWRPASPFSLPNSQAFQHDDSLGDLIALRPKIRQHFVDIHFSSVP
jgi:hypothetical protein